MADVDDDGVGSLGNKAHRHGAVASGALSVTGVLSVPKPFPASGLRGEYICLAFIVDSFITIRPNKKYRMFVTSHLLVNSFHVTT